MILAPEPYLSMKDTPATDDAAVPPGWEPVVAGGPYFRALGPLYRRSGGEGVALALRVDASHLNMQQVAHGGMLTTLADGALAFAISQARGRARSHVTVSLSADYLSAARQGDWLEAHVSITRLGRTMAFANCDLKVGTRHVLRSNGVFAIHDREAGAGPSDG